MLLSGHLGCRYPDVPDVVTTRCHRCSGVPLSQGGCLVCCAGVIVVVLSQPPGVASIVTDWAS